MKKFLKNMASSFFPEFMVAIGCWIVTHWLEKKVNSRNKQSKFKSAVSKMIDETKELYRMLYKEKERTVDYYRFISNIFVIQLLILMIPMFIYLFFQVLKFIFEVPLNSIMSEEINIFFLIIYKLIGIIFLIIDFAVSVPKIEFWKMVSFLAKFLMQMFFLGVIEYLDFSYRTGLEDLVSDRLYIYLLCIYIFFLLIFPLQVVFMNPWDVESAKKNYYNAKYLKNIYGIKNEIYLNINEELDLYRKIEYDETKIDLKIDYSQCNFKMEGKYKIYITVIPKDDPSKKFDIYTYLEIIDNRNDKRGNKFLEFIETYAKIVTIIVIILLVVLVAYNLFN